MPWIALDAATQALDEGIDAAHRDERVAAPDARQQRLAAEHDARVRREQVQQTEFLIRQLDVAAGDADASARRIDLDVMDAHGSVASVWRHRRARPPQQRARPRHELAHTERLREVIVRAAFEAEDLVRLFGARGQDQNRHVAVRAAAADGAADAEAVQPGNHHVEDDQVEPLVLRARDRLPAVRKPFTRVAFEAEMQTDQFADVRLVFDDEHARRGGVFHRPVWEYEQAGPSV